MVEYKGRERVGNFLDRRFGENDKNMSVEEKLMERFAKEKSRRMEKGELFNLESDDEELTHFGQSLSKLEDISEHDPRLDDDLELDSIDKARVESLHFGGFQENDDMDGRKKSYKEIMEEIIAKSKMHKLERQKIKEENEELRRELNDDFEDIRTTLLDASDRHKEENRKVLLSAPKQNNDYDVMVRELAYEKKAKPSDRLKTEDEIAKEEAERLEKLEQERIKRMSGTDINVADAHDNDTQKNRGGDDLGINYVLENDSFEQPLAYDNGEMILRQNSAIHSSESESHAPENSFEDYGDDSESSFEEIESQNSRESVAEEQNNGIPYVFKAPSSYVELLENFVDKSIDQHLMIIQRMRTLYHKSLKPENGKTLKKLMILLIQHFELSIKFICEDESKREKNPFYGNLSASFQREMSKIAPHELLSMIVKGLSPIILEMGLEYPDEFSACCLSRTRVFQNSLVKMRVGKSQNFRTVVRPHELMMVSLICRFYSTSDFRHQIMDVVYLLIDEWISNITQMVFLCSDDKYSRKNFLLNCVSGLFLSHLFLECQNLSKRYMTSIPFFLFCILRSMRQNNSSKMLSFMQKTVFPYVDKSENFAHLINSIDNEAWKGIKMQKLPIFEILVNGDLINDDFTAPQLLLMASKTVQKFSSLYSSLEENYKKPSLGSGDALDAGFGQENSLGSIYVNLPHQKTWPWVETFHPFIELIDLLLTENPLIHEFLRENLTSLTNKLKETAVRIIKQRELYARNFGLPEAYHRLPLQLHRKRDIKGFKSLVPKFDAKFNPDRHYDPNPRRQEEKKTKALYQKELRGAMRELKKDSAFLAKTRLEETKAADAAYERKMKRIYGIISQDNANAADFNSPKRKKD